MPATEVVLFAEDDGSAPVVEWLDHAPEKVRFKCIVRIERLRECGYELRRPEAAPLAKGIYELRIRHMNVHYRILYFFHEHKAVLSHVVRKEREVPAKEIDRAVRHRRAFETDPVKHTYREE